jgi:hypothetical protein
LTGAARFAIESGGALNPAFETFALCEPIAVMRETAAE